MGLCRDIQMDDEEEKERGLAVSILTEAASLSLCQHVEKKNELRAEQQLETHTLHSDHFDQCARLSCPSRSKHCSAY
jgi:hypothetical protein